MGNPVLLVGTRKGVFTLTADDARTRWTTTGPMFLGHIVQHVVLDPRDDAARCWPAHRPPRTDGVPVRRPRGRPGPRRPRPPAFRTRASAFGPQPRRSVLAHARPRRRTGSLVRRGTPQGLFRSDDGGDTWATARRLERPSDVGDLVPSAPTRTHPDGPMLHSIIVDPRDPTHLYLGLSGGGVFESTDGGADWQTAEPGTGEADFLPDPDAEFGHDPHCVRLHPARPDRLYQQNHCGIYRLDRPDDRWERIGDNMPADVGDIGFPDRAASRATPTPPGSSRWTAPTSGRAPARTAARRSTARATPARPGSASTTACPEPGLVHREAPGHDRRRARPGRPVLRHDQRRAVGEPRRGRHVATDRRNTCPRSTRSRPIPTHAPVTEAFGVVVKVRIPTPLRSYTDERRRRRGRRRDAGRAARRPRPALPRAAVPG